MADAVKFDPKTVKPIVDPTTGSGDLYVFPEAMGQKGRPFVLLVEDPPNKTRSRHYHHGDVIYFYIKGEHHIEGEGTYRAGDVRWTKKGHRYGPETTGPEGGAWWIISYSDPIPVDIDGDEPEQETLMVEEDTLTAERSLPTFSKPYDWKAIDKAVQKIGGAIVKGLVPEEALVTLNDEIDNYLAKDNPLGDANSGSDFYDKFLGKNTIRLHGLVDKVPSSGGLIGDQELVDWAERMLAAKSTSVLLNAGELIQIKPGEPAQYLHRDSDSWPSVPIEENPVIVNAIIACGPIDEENGATYIAPESWSWDPHRQPTDSELLRAVMDAGDAVLFRGDLLHGGGENESSAPRRAISISYCAGWLRPVENSFLNIPLERVKQLPPKLQALLGFKPHDAIGNRGGLLGLYEGGDPAKALR